MYTPAPFLEDDPETLHAFMRAYPLATLVSQGETALQASPVPLLLNDNGVLQGHLARANPHWQQLGEAKALAIFMGENYYVSPSWYPTKGEHGKVVPTWNYLAVHAHGTVKVFDDKDWLRDFLIKLTTAHESARATPWEVTDAPSDYIENLLGAIVGFELRIDKLEGKFKQSQNRRATDREGVRLGRLADLDRT